MLQSGPRSFFGSDAFKHRLWSPQMCLYFQSKFLIAYFAKSLHLTCTHRCYLNRSMANVSPSLFAINVSLLFIQLTQKWSQKRTKKNSLQYPGSLSATSYWFSGALFIDLFSRERTFCSLYSLQISLWNIPSSVKKPKAKWKGWQCHSIVVGGGERSYPLCPDSAEGQKNL